MASLVLVVILGAALLLSGRFVSLDFALGEISRDFSSLSKI